MGLGAPPYKRNSAPRDSVPSEGPLTVYPGDTRLHRAHARGVSCNRRQFALTLCVVARRSCRERWSGKTTREQRSSGTAVCAGLVGWWHSRAEDDPVGHILRITPDFGRYTAVKDSAQDLAEMKVLSSMLSALIPHVGHTSDLSAFSPSTRHWMRYVIALSVTYCKALTVWLSQLFSV